jgi:molybdopterin converting factor small subunit
LDTIQIHLKSYFSMGLPEELRSRERPGQPLTITLDAGTTIDGLLARYPSLGLGGPEFDLILVFVNGTLRSVDHRLENNDELAFHIPPTGG